METNQVIQSDSFDLSMWIQASKHNPEIRMALASLPKERGEALSVDLFTLAYRRVAKRTETETHTAIAKANAPTIDAIESDPANNAAFQSTKGKRLPSALLVSQTLKRVAPEIAKQEAEREAKRKEREERLRKAKAIGRLEAEQSKVEQEVKLENALGAAAIVKAIQIGTEEAEDLIASIGHLESDLGIRIETDSLQDSLTLAQTLARNPALLAILKQAGKLFATTAKKLGAREATSSGARVGVELSDRLRDVVSSEFAQPKALFASNLAQHSLQTWKREARKPKERGDFIATIDESGSMSGFKIAWAKALTLAIVKIAKHDKRNVTVVRYAESSRVHIETLRFRDKSFSLSADWLLKFATDFFNGYSTCFDGWMVYVAKSANVEMDVINIGDGAGYYTPESLKLYNEARAKGVHVWSIMLPPGDEETFKALSDETFQVSAQALTSSADAIGDKLLSRIIK